MASRYKYQIAQPYYTLLHTLYHSTHFRSIFMAALHSRYGHYIFALWFLSSFFLSCFFPRLISAVADWMSTILLHMVCP